MVSLAKTLEQMDIDFHISSLPGSLIKKIAGKLNISIMETMIILLENNIWPERFLRNKTIFSSHDQIKVMKFRPLIVGCGGLGGHVAALFARLGVCSLKICDPDVFEESNLNRQLFCTEKSIGKLKVSVARNMLLEIASYMEIEALNMAATVENLPELLLGMDMAIDCLDSVPRKKMLAKASEKAAIPYLHGAVLEQEGFASLNLPGTDQLEILYPDINSGNDHLNTNHTLAPTVDGTAALMVSLAINNFILKKPASSLLLHLDLTAPSIDSYLVEL